MANNISESLKGKKRPREADIDAPTGDFDQIPRLEENLTFSSTLVGLRMMRAQFPNNEKTLRREKVLRGFKLNTGQDDHAIIFLDNYLCQMERVVKRFKEKDEDILEVFKWFKWHIIYLKLKPSIGHQELVSDWSICVLLGEGFFLRQFNALNKIMIEQVAM